MPRRLPANPNLEQYKKQAKDLLRRLKAADAEAGAWIAQHHPRASKAGSAAGRAEVALADVQVALAREHGFDTWAQFAQEIDRRTSGAADADRVWREAERAVLRGDADALDALMRGHREQFEKRQPPAFGPEPGRLAPHYGGGGDARAIIAANHHFATWDDFARWRVEADRPDSPAARFESAVDAIVDGDEAALARLLRAHPDLVRARSARAHHSTLLHYVGANGIEAFRQKTPGNAVAIARMLLDAGSEVDAPAGMYGGGSTTLGLVATSIHPLLAGVQNELIALLLDRGAVIDEPRAGGNDSSAIAGCLANGRPQAAEFLARRGARLNLDGAAGIGRLDIVRHYFDDRGQLTGGATRSQLRQGFAWACQYGHADVVEFLLQHGIDVDDWRRGTTPLHWAAYGGNAAVARVLLAAQAPVDTPDDTFAGTPLGWAIYGWGETAAGPEREPYYEIVAMLVRAGGTVDPRWLLEEDRGYPLDEFIRADPRMGAALRGEVV
jgi:hypothetical protein